MDRLTADAIREIERIHSRWIELEIAGENHRLIELCASDIELWPPDALPVRGRSAVSEHMAQEGTEGDGHPNYLSLLEPLISKGLSGVTRLGSNYHDLDFFVNR